MEDKNEMTVEHVDDEFCLVTGLDPCIGGLVTSLGAKKKGKKGWLVPKEVLHKVQVLHRVYTGDGDALPSNPRSRLGQRRFRREGSDVESSDDSDSPDDSESSEEDTCKSEERYGEGKYKPEESRDMPHSRTRPMGSVDPAVLLADSSDDSEGSDYGSSSDSDFPEGCSPRNHAQEYRKVIARRRKFEQGRRKTSELKKER